MKNSQEEKATASWTFMDKLFNIVVAISLASLFFGLLWTYRETGSNNVKYIKVCVNHVEYLKFSHGVTIQRDSHGNVVGCNQS